jgi:16S rRNA C967 or C1407 C5-methylase (RsmB/RsmF family)/NOL1/NOP2/fmu family ribosome biogenesis protein
MAALLDEEFPSFLVALGQAPLSALRVNTLKVTVSRFVELSPWELQPVPWCPEAFLLPRHNTASMYPLYDAGLYYIQEPSTTAVAALLAPRPGERVLDLCAAPGGKATHLAALMQGQGVLVANEIDGKRAEVLARHLELWGARQAIVLSETPDRLAERWPACFDRVLVDAPCSGEGMFRKNEQARLHWNESHVTGCALRQREILDAAARLVRPGGTVAYATCTFAPEENEGVVWRFLQRHPDFELVRPVGAAGFASGRPDWVDWPAGVLAQLEGQLPDFPPERLSLQRTVRLWPHKAEGEGHFIALLRRSGERPAAPWDLAEVASRDLAGRRALEEFWEPLINEPLPERLVVRHRRDGNTAVHAVTPDTPDTQGLRAVRPGWHLGFERKGRFVPSHALAMGLSCRAVAHRLEEALGSERVARYLHGDTLSVPGPEGWILIGVAGFALGWGKRSGNVIKNHYPRALRWP